jgi:hypothetical protein
VADGPSDGRAETRPLTGEEFIESLRRARLPHRFFTTSHSADDLIADQ